MALPSVVRCMRSSCAASDLVYRLSTYDWSWEPWLKQVFDVVLDDLRVLYGNKLGIVSAHVELSTSVDRSGAISHIEVQRHTGHESYVKSSVEAIRSVSGVFPMPDTFPEQELVLPVSLYYSGLPE